MIWLIVRFQFDGLHQWKEASNFLRHSHHHVFLAEVWIEEKHNNRELEFLEVREVMKSRNWLGTTESSSEKETSLKSCEMMAQEMIDFVQNKYGADRKVRAFVYEDNGCGSCVESYL